VSVVGSGGGSLGGSVGGQLGVSRGSADRVSVSCRNFLQTITVSVTGKTHI